MLALAGASIRRGLACSFWHHKAAARRRREATTAQLCAAGGTDDFLLPAGVLPDLMLLPDPRTTPSPTCSCCEHKVAARREERRRDCSRINSTTPPSTSCYVHTKGTRPNPPASYCYMLTKDTPAVLPSHGRAAGRRPAGRPRTTVLHVIAQHRYSTVQRVQAQASHSKGLLPTARFIGVNYLELMPCHELNELEYSTSSNGEAEDTFIAELAVGLFMV